MENKIYISLSWGEYAIQFSLSIYLILISIILLINGGLLISTVLFLTSIIIGLIRIYSLRIRVLKNSMSNIYFERVTKKFAQRIGGKIMGKSENGFIQIYRNGWGIGYGEVISIKQGERGVYINSRCMDSRGFVLSSFGRNKLNYKLFKELLEE